jgi:hypothetical protein
LYDVEVTGFWPVDALIFQGRPSPLLAIARKRSFLNARRTGIVDDTA